MDTLDDPEPSLFAAPRALVVGASGGIGAAVAAALAAPPRDYDVTTISRRQDGLDIASEASVAAAAGRLAADNARPFDLIFDATGVLEAAGRRPEKAFAELTPEAMATAFAVNALGPALLFKHFAPLLRREGRAVFATLSARVGSIGDNRLGGWISYRASKAALNQVVRCAAIEFSRANPEGVVVALHPGTIETPMTAAYARGRYTDSAAGAAGMLLNVIDALEPGASGGFYDYAGTPVPW